MQRPLSDFRGRAETKSDRQCGLPLVNQSIRSAQAPVLVAANDVAKGTASTLILTAVPVGKLWRVKALDASRVDLFGVFSSRLEALGAATLFAAHVGGRVVP